MGDFNKCLPVTLKFEGGKVDNPKDPGGKTAYGITQRTYDAWRRKKGLPTFTVAGTSVANSDVISWHCVGF